MVTRKKILAGFGWVAFSKYATRLLSFVTTLVLAKLLVPEDFGLVAVAWMVIEILRIFKDLGLGQALIYRQDEIQTASSTAFYMMIAFNSFIFLIAVAASPFIADFFENPEITVILIVMSSNLIWFSLRAVPDALIRKEIDFKKLIIPDIAPVVIGSIVGIYMAYDGYGVWSLVVKSLIADVLGTIFIWRYTSFRPSLVFDMKIAKELFHYGKYIIGSSIFAIALYNIDKFYLSKFDGIATLGLYTLAAGIANMPVSEFGHMVCRVMFPVFSKLNKDISRVRETFIKTFRISGLITIPMAIGLAVYGPDLVKMFFDEKWYGISVPLQILAISALFRSQSVICHEVLRAMGNPKVVQHFLLFRLFIIGLIGIPAIQNYGLVGFCYLVLVTYAVVLIWEILVSGKQLELNYIELLGKLALPVFASAIIPLIYYLLSLSVDNLQLMHIIAGILITIPSYFLVVFSVDKSIYQEFIGFVKPSRQQAGKQS